MNYFLVWKTNWFQFISSIIASFQRFYFTNTLRSSLILRKMGIFLDQVSQLLLTRKTMACNDTIGILILLFHNSLTSSRFKSSICFISLILRWLWFVIIWRSTFKAKIEIEIVINKFNFSWPHYKIWIQIQEFIYIRIFSIYIKIYF